MFAKTGIASVLMAIATHASALCMATTPASIDSPYDYYVALTSALKSTRDARDGATSALSRGINENQSAIALLTALKTSERNYSCAQQYVESYTKSTNQGIAVSAAGVETALISLQMLVQGVEQTITDVLNGSGSNVPAGTRAQKTADMNVQFNEAWQTLMLGVVVSSNAAPHFDNTDHLDGIALPAKQRADIIHRLQAFGPAVEHEDNNPPLETSIAMLLKHFRNKQLKSFDH